MFLTKILHREQNALFQIMLWIRFGTRRFRFEKTWILPNSISNQTETSNNLISRENHFIQFRIDHVLRLGSSNPLNEYNQS